MAAKRKILTDGLTNKQRILRMVERWDDDISFEQALYHMYVMKGVMEGIKDAEEGRTLDFDEVFDELERACDEEENAAADLAQGKTRSQRTAGTHRERGRPKNGAVIRKPAKKVRQRAT